MVRARLITFAICDHCYLLLVEVSGWLVEISLCMMHDEYACTLSVCSEVLPVIVTTSCEWLARYYQSGMHDKYCSSYICSGVLFVIIAAWTL